VKSKRPIVAIDGPVGAGKSTVARELARRLGFGYVNTGAMYRAVAVAARQAGISPGQGQIEERLLPVLKTIKIDFDGERTLLGGQDISRLIGEPETGELASYLSTLRVVRAKMRELQRSLGARGGVVMEGRDIGTAVFPDAEFKFLLDADPQVRAERRFRELAAKRTSASREQVLEALLQRDRRDRTRQLAPLRRAEDAVVIDSTSLSVSQVVEVMMKRIESGLARPRA